MIKLKELLTERVFSISDFEKMWTNEEKINPPLSKEEIKRIYEKNGLKVDKIVRSRLNDGYFVYHDRGMERMINTRTLISKTDYKAVYQTGKENIRSDFIEDGDPFSIMNSIVEAKRRR